MGNQSYLHHPVEELLRHPCSALDPRLLLPASEELRSLQYGQVLVGKVGRRFAQKFWPRAEVGVEDDDDLSAGAVEGVPKVSGFLELRAVVPPNVCFMFLSSVGV